MPPPKPKPVAAPDIRAQFFPVTPRVNEDIDAWLLKRGARKVAVIPVYWEDPNASA